MQEFILKHCRNPWRDLLIMLVGIAWLLVPTQAWRIVAFTSESIRTEVTRTNSPAYRAKRHEAEQRLVPLMQDQLKRAEALGPGYSPDKFYTDLREMWICSFQATGMTEDPRPSCDAVDKLVKKLGTLSRRYVRDHLAAPDNLNPERIQRLLKEKPYTSLTQETALQDFTKWRMEFDRQHGPPAEPIDWKGGVLPWLLWLYLGSLPFAALFYLVVVDTYCADQVFGNRSRFLCAVALWPIYVGKYPKEYLREFWVETFLRLRFQNLWRRLRPEEKNRIREIARSGSYGNWIRQQWRARKGWQHSLLIGMLATLTLSLVPARAKPPPLPAIAVSSIHAHTSLSQRKIPYHHYGVAHPPCYEHVIMELDRPVHDPWHEEPVLPCPGWPRPFWTQDWYRSIEHVPLG